MRELCDLTRYEYQLVLESGLMWEIYPKATGVWFQDSQEKEEA